jgi:hypothetical protein
MLMQTINEDRGCKIHSSVVSGKETTFLCGSYDTSVISLLEQRKSCLVELKSILHGGGD